MLLFLRGRLKQLHWLFSAHHRVDTTLWEGIGCLSKLPQAADPYLTVTGGKRACVSSPAHLPSEEEGEGETLRLPLFLFRTFLFSTVKKGTACSVERKNNVLDHLSGSPVQGEPQSGCWGVLSWWTQLTSQLEVATAGNAVLDTFGLASIFTPIRCCLVGLYGGVCWVLSSGRIVEKICNNPDCGWPYSGEVKI